MPTLCNTTDGNLFTATLQNASGFAATLTKNAAPTPLNLIEAEGYHSNALAAPTTHDIIVLGYEVTQQVGRLEIKGSCFLPSGVPMPSIGDSIDITDTSDITYEIYLEQIKIKSASSGTTSSYVEFMGVQKS